MDLSSLFSDWEEDKLFMEACKLSIEFLVYVSASSSSSPLLTRWSHLEWVVRAPVNV
ncbi:hypothetical protein HanIR_Chr13g0665751 [Helianthus annuus]|nr:hypothetical protein HanIR_Chr13g0665751 [Helianthus annuus]